MKKGPSTYAEYWTSDINEGIHFGRHGKQMGYEDIFKGKVDIQGKHRNLQMKQEMIFYLLLQMRLKIMLLINTNRQPTNL